MFISTGPAAKERILSDSPTDRKQSLMSVITFLISVERSSIIVFGWLRGTVVERRSVACELPLSCAQPAADG